MDSGFSLIKALANTLPTEIDSLVEDDRNLLEKGTFDLSEKAREFEIKLIRTNLSKTGESAPHFRWRESDDAPQQNQNLRN
jgi:hypothetical protein